MPVLLQAPGRAADAAWTEDAFLEALLDHRSGLSPAAYHELAALQPLAHDGLAVVLDRVPLPPPTQQPRAWGMFVLQRLGTTHPAVVEPWRAWAARWRIAAPCVVRWAFVACIGDGPPGPGWGSPRPCTYDPVPLTVAREALSVTVRGDLLHDTEDDFLRRARSAYRGAYKRLRASHGFERGTQPRALRGTVSGPLRATCINGQW